MKKRTLLFERIGPESHNIIRCGKGISPRPTLDRDIYKRHGEGHVECKHLLPSEYVPYINSVIDSAIGSVPDRENGLGYESFENVFQARAISGVVAAEVNECKADFKDGEAQLESMTQQLKASGLYKDNKSQYKADGLIKMDGIKKLEIVLLETSYHFGSKDKCKAAFDHHKGLFGSLSMLKTIADCFSLGTMESFKTVKVFFVQAAETTVYLWSLRFESIACLYEFWLEDRLTIKPSIKDKSEALPGFIRFYWNMKI
ncbi:hypothetical protein G6F43_004462 [Rhizopus delemar]|nr:hypothetical protein G6F43_004462 [Rhizopus delemar]